VNLNPARSTDGAVRGVLAGNPLGVIERQISGEWREFFSLAWKILRGAEVASTKMVTVGSVAAQL
jgi:hypothetical protein